MVEMNEYVDMKNIKGSTYVCIDKLYIACSPSPNNKILS